MPTLSIHEEISRLAPVDLEGTAPALQPLGMLQLWQETSQNLARMGKQHLRANQNTEHHTGQVQAALAEVRQVLADVHERAEEYRRENLRLNEDAARTASRIVEIMDVLDDVGLLARQRGDTQWTSYVDRITRKTQDILGRIGLSEIPATAGPYNEEEHEVLGTMAHTPGQEPYHIAELVRRGYRYKGRILRRAQIITTR